MLTEYNSSNLVLSDFIVDIINGMYDWVRVIDLNNNVIFMNRAMCEGVGGCHVGQKCYLTLGKEKVCDDCLMKRMLFNPTTHEKEEHFNGKTYSVMSSPLKNSKGKVISAVEVLRDITQLKILQQKVELQNVQLKTDLEAAKQLQQSLLPTNFSNENIDFSFIYEPCELLGGDYFDIFKIDDEHLGFLIADVSGHGISSSMLTVFLRSSLEKDIVSPSLALTKLYKKFNQSGLYSGLYITVFYAVLNITTRELTYSNSGHNVIPIIYNYEKLEFLNLPGIPISNWLPDPDYKEKTTKLNSGDSILLYTDGIVELRNKYGKQFGEEKLLDIITLSIGSPSEIINTIKEELNLYKKEMLSSDVSDDITAVIIKLS